MFQVLLRIPLQVGAYPVWPFLVAVCFVAAAVAWIGANTAGARWGWDPKNVRGVAIWIAIAGAIAGGLAYFFQKGGLPIFGFGAMLFVAFVACNWIATRRALREGISKETIQDLAVWLIVGGLIGGRVASMWHVYSEGKEPWPKSLLEFFSELIRIWQGGLVLYGAVMGGILAYAVGYWVTFRKQGVSTLKLMDVLAPTLAVGICIGRIGCFLNGCCFGQVACPDCAAVGVPFPLSAPARSELVQEGYQTVGGFTVAGDVIVDKVEPGSAADGKLQRGDVIEQVDEQDVRGRTLSDPIGAALSLSGAAARGKNDFTLSVAPPGEPPRAVTLQPWTLPLHPTQLYETISMFLLFLVLTAYYPFRRRDGQVMALMMVCYGVHRFLNELLRIDARPEGLESHTSELLIVAGLGLWLWLQSRPAQYRIVPFVAQANAALGAVKPSPV
jgi:phosphatidylglycerol:prolipoprotein diacylglycerol transferase